MGVFGAAELGAEREGGVRVAGMGVFAALSPRSAADVIAGLPLFALSGLAGSRVVAADVLFGTIDREAADVFETPRNSSDGPSEKERGIGTGLLPVLPSQV